MKRRSTPQTKVTDSRGRSWHVCEAKRSDVEGSWGALFESEGERRCLPSYLTYNTESLGTPLAERSRTELLSMLSRAERIPPEGQ